MKKTIITILSIALVSCAKQQKSTINPTDNYHVVISAHDTNHVLLHGKLTIGNSVLNIRQGFKDSVLIDTFITDDVSLGLSHKIYLSKINPNCTLNQDTTGNIKLAITGSSYSYSVTGAALQ